jgi:hypothetical protein
MDIESSRNNRIADVNSIWPFLYSFRNRLKLCVVSASGVLPQREWPSWVHSASPSNRSRNAGSGSVNTHTVAVFPFWSIGSSLSIRPASLGSANPSSRPRTPVTPSCDLDPTTTVLLLLVLFSLRRWICMHLPMSIPPLASSLEMTAFAWLHQCLKRSAPPSTSRAPWLVQPRACICLRGSLGICLMHPCLKWFLLPSLKMPPMPTMSQALFPSTLPSCHAHSGRPGR